MSLLKEKPYLFNPPVLKFIPVTLDLGSGAYELQTVATHGSKPQCEAHDEDLSLA